MQGDYLWSGGPSAAKKLPLMALGISYGGGPSAV